MTPPVLRVVPGLAPASHVRHALHGEGAIWPEKNCYADLWIELLHALGLEPHAMLPFVLGVDFEGDQWTFYKPSHDELRQLYGIEVSELTVWRPMLQHAREHLGAGKWLSVEVDAHWLPDTAGTDYRQAHAKTTIVLNEVDEAGERLGYFHNAGYHALGGEDFRRVLRIGEDADPAFLPLFAELVRLDRVVRHPAPRLRELTRALLATHLARRPARPPVERFAQRLAQELPALQAAGLAHYHRWAFGSVRQMGSAYELASACLDWLAPDGTLAEPARAFRRLAELAKALILKGARSVATRRPLGAEALLDEAAAAWHAGMGALQAALR